MAKVFWFSRHELTPEQIDGLKFYLQTEEDLDIVHVSKTVKTAEELKALTPKDADVIAVVLPVKILSEYFEMLDGPVLIPRSKRVLHEDQSVEFVYDGWEVITDIVYKSYFIR